MTGFDLLKYVSKLNLPISNSKFCYSLSAVSEFLSAIWIEHARYYCDFYCHAKVRAYARCAAIRQSVGHNRPDSQPGTKYANSADVGAGPTKTINANDCMCSYIDGFIKISMRTRARIEGGDWRSGRAKEERGNAARCEWKYYLGVVKLSARYISRGLIANKFMRGQDVSFLQNSDASMLIYVFFFASVRTKRFCSIMANACTGI